MSVNNCTPMNQMILTRREETEKFIKNEYEKVFKKHESVKNQEIDVRKRVKTLHEESNILNHKSMLLTSEVAEMTSNIAETQGKLVEISCKIDGVLTKQIQTSMVKEKELKTLEIYYKKIKEQTDLNQQFWLKELKEESLNELQKTVETLNKRKQSLENQITKMTEKNTGVDATKLTEDCMIIKKRNAAMQKRLVRRLQMLENQLEETRRNKKLN